MYYVYNAYFDHIKRYRHWWNKGFRCSRSCKQCVRPCRRNPWSLTLHSGQSTLATRKEVMTSSGIRWQRRRPYGYLSAAAAAAAGAAASAKSR